MTDMAVAAELRGGFDALGYGSDLTRERVGATPIVLDLVAFASCHVQDMSTSALAGARADLGADRSIADVLDSARSIAAPAALVSDGHTMRLVAVSADRAGDTSIDEFSVSELRPHLGRFRHALGPEVLGRAKQSRSVQLPLFPIDVRLLTETRGAVTERISSRVQSAFVRAAEVAGVEAAPRAVVAALVALVVRDRYGFGSRPAAELAEASVRTLGLEFSWFPELVERAGEGTDAALDELDVATDFSTLDSAVVSNLYEELLVTASSRAELGIHYTPFNLAEKIASAIPFEELDPDHRHVLDPTCGSGTLLLASHARLAAIAPGRWSEKDTHQRLRGSIRGWDIDPMAVEIARLCLVVHSLPFGNHWDVKQQNMFDGNEVTTDRPQVVVSNPPWDVVKGKRKESAEVFLARMSALVGDGGFLACVLPAGWLTKPSSAASRRALGESFDVFEVWRLPRDVFRFARQPTAVVFARKERTGRPWLFRQVAPGRPKIAKFLETGEAAFARLSLSQPENGERAALNVFDSVAGFRDLPKLTSIAKVSAGVVLKKRSDMKTVQRGGVLVFPRGEAVAPLSELTTGSLVRVPNLAAAAVDSSYPGELSRFAAVKVLVPAQRFPDNAWRSRPLFDRTGCVPNESWQALIPTSGGDNACYALMALFASATVSTWFLFRSATRRMSVRDYEDLPVPGSISVLSKRLSRFGRRIVAGDREHQLFAELDEEVETLYELNDRTRAVIRTFVEGQMAPEGNVRYAERSHPLAAADSGLTRSGAVLTVEADKVCLWADDLSHEGIWVPLPHRIPGWICEAGATFEVVGTDLATAEYRLHRTSYMSEHALLTQLRDAQ